MVNIFFTIIDLYRRDHLEDILCIILASSFHYFILSSFSWIFILSLIQYFLFVKVFPHSIPAFTRKAACFAQSKKKLFLSFSIRNDRSKILIENYCLTIINRCRWSVRYSGDMSIKSMFIIRSKQIIFRIYLVVPLVPVITVLIIDPWSSTKRSDQMWGTLVFIDGVIKISRWFQFSCWLSDRSFYASFILPIAGCILTNSILFIFVGYSLLCDKTNQRLRRVQMAEAYHLLRFALAFLCFLGFSISWLFGIFAIGSSYLAFQILFCIFISITGFTLLSLYLLTAKAKRTDWNSE